MEHTPIERLELLREIAETINEAYEMEPMLDSVLKKLLQLTGLKSGWVFLTKPETRRFQLAADAALPPALGTDEKSPMKAGSCWCLEQLRTGRLHHAANILHCKRIDDAIRLRRGDTDGITHHASIPLRSGDEVFGILNVASPGRTRFSEEELALLQSVAYQIGTASHRIRLFRTERKRADLFTKLGEAARRLGTLQATEGLEEEMLRASAEQMGWPSLALYVGEGSGACRRTSCTGGKVEQGAIALTDSNQGMIRQAFLGRPMLWRDSLGEGGTEKGRWRSGAAVPIRLKSKVWGVLATGSDDPDELDGIDLEALEALAAHLALTVETIALNEKSRELTRWEERNRIARDLHDSVSQMLFSLSLNAKGLTQALPDEALSEATKEALGQIQRLSQSAIGEMRAMIRQLRPAGLEEGLLTGLRRYGEQIGLEVTFLSGELRDLPERLQSVFWRIGQEALNNVSKHAGTNSAAIEMTATEWEAIMTISDGGRGIALAEQANGTGTYGMATMRERAESVGGSVAVKSEAGRGTRIRVRLPL